MKLTAAVVVCTKDRPSDLERCIRSLLDSLQPDCEVIVVDQSIASVSEDIVRTLSAGKEISYIHSAPRGLSAARNEGMRASNADILLFTDDDCTVEGSSWVSFWIERFADKPEVAVGFGTVAPAPFDPAAGTIPSWSPKLPERVVGCEVFMRGADTVGMGANMVCRRMPLLEVGGFDESLGAGSRFPAAEEVDVAYRLTARGYRMCQAAGPHVVHWGLRHPMEARCLHHGYAVGLGAMFAKHVRCGDWVAARMLALQLGRLMMYVGKSVATGRRPTRATQVGGVLTGLRRSFCIPLDRRTKTFRIPVDPAR